VDLEELAGLVADLLHEGGDTAEVEAKRAAGGFPDSALPTISAFANTPGGGTIIFGLDESADFAAVGVYDVTACKTTLATKARPPSIPRSPSMSGTCASRVSTSSSRGSTSFLPMANPAA
jgi:ATP-dependent DNA helicase RecG